MSSPDFGHTEWAEQKRMEKAVALETRLAIEKIPVDAARTLPPASRRRIERAAGVRKCSDETWAKTFALMEDYEASLRRIAEEKL